MPLNGVIFGFKMGLFLVYIALWRQIFPEFIRTAVRTVVRTVCCLHFIFGCSYAKK